MPTTNPRLNMVLEEPVYRMIVGMARKSKISVSAKARDLLLQAIELEEDKMLAGIVSSRLKEEGADITHEEVWAHLR